MDIFDIIGPVMVGPSSSHTAGAVRIGLIARNILGEAPAAARIALHGSFALTGKGHGTDRALAAGILGMRPDDPRIPDSLRLAEQAGLEISFAQEDLGEVHPNTARIELTGESGRTCRVQASSIGGGNIAVTNVNGIEVDFDGRRATLVVVHRDRPGVVAAVAELLTRAGCNIAAMRLYRTERHGDAFMILQTDEPPAPELVARLGTLEHVREASVLPPVA